MVMWEMIKTAYEVVGIPHPRASLAMAALVGAVLFGLAWWLIGKGYEISQRRHNVEALPRSTSVSAQPRRENKIEAAQLPVVNPPSGFIDPFVGSQIRSLLHELTLVSGKQFRSEFARTLMPDEALGTEKRLELFALAHGKTTVVEGLRELSTAFHGVEQFLLYNHRVAPGYQRVAEKYQQLLLQRWVLGAEKYKKGSDPNPNPDFRTCVYGLVEIDQKQLDELRVTLDEVEKVIRETPPPDLVPTFRIDYLTIDLQKAGIPINGMSAPQAKPTPENDATPAEYFKLTDGRYARLTKDKDITLTPQQKEQAGKIILAHERTMEKQDKIIAAVRIALVRDGQRTSTLRFTRSESEFKFDPERFVAVDTEMGILEIRGHTPFTSEQRSQIKTVVTDQLISLGIKTQKKS
jgi:hypothetical protein